MSEIWDKNFVYQYNIFIFGIYLIPSILSLLLMGWTAGFLVAGFLIRYGTKIQTLSWTGVALILPFSAPFFPVSTLPNWAQQVAYFTPASHVFETLCTTGAKESA